jgi:hypothetical protein
MRITLAAFLTIILLSSTAVFAQETKVGPVKLKERDAAMTIDRVIRVSTGRMENFNNEIQVLNSMRPLEVANLDSASIVKNLQLVQHSLAWFKAYQDTANWLARTLRDSITIYRNAVPAEYRAKFLKTFEDAYAADVANSQNYTTNLLSVWNQVADMLHFMQSAKYLIEGGKLNFPDKATYDAYVALMTKFDLANKAFIAAGEANRTSLAGLNAALKDLYSRIN